MIQIFGNAPNQISCLTLITFALVMHIHLLLVSDQHSNIFPTLPNKLQSMKFTQIWVKGSKKKKPLWQSILSRKESRSFLCVEVPHFFFFIWWMEEIVCPGRSATSPKASLQCQHIFPHTCIFYTKTLPSYPVLDSTLSVAMCI